MRLSPLDPLGWGFKCGIAFAHSIAGRYSAAVDWADRCLHEQARCAVAIRIKVASCAHLGRIEEAHDWLRRLLILQPGLTIAEYRKFAPALVSPEIFGIYLEGLRKAGLPEE